jgi:chromosome segregation ATPase
MIMSNNNNDLRFRSSIRGFHREDVLSYLEQKAREHVEERSELVDKLESSQQELSELKAKLAQAESELQNKSAEAEARASELEQLRAELDRLHSTNADLAEKCTSLNLELDDLRAERDTLSEEMESLKAQKDEIEATKIRVAEIELDAYTRAKKIENDAIENANLARKTLTDLIADAKRSFDSVKLSANKTLQRMVDEMEGLKDALQQIPEGFELISNNIESLGFKSEKKADVSDAEPVSAEDIADNSEIVGDLSAANSDEVLGEESFSPIDVDDNDDIDKEKNGDSDQKGRRERPVLEKLLFFRGKEDDSEKVFLESDSGKSAVDENSNEESSKDREGYTYSFSPDD